MTPHDRIRLIGPLSGRATATWVWCGVLSAYAALIFWASSSARPFGFSSSLGGWDVVAHGLCYFGFCLVALGSVAGRHRLLFAVLLSLAFAASDEVHQLFVPGRVASVVDGLADAVGCLAASAVVVAVRGNIGEMPWESYTWPPSGRKRKGETCCCGALRSTDRASSS